MGMGAVFAASTSPCVTVDIPLIFADTLIHYSVHLEPPASREQVRAKNFGVILVSFWCPWVSFGDPGRPKGPPREPSRKSDEKVGSLVLRGPSLVTPFGAQIRHKL